MPGNALGKLAFIAAIAVHSTIASLRRSRGAANVRAPCSTEWGIMSMLGRCECAVPKAGSDDGSVMGHNASLMIIGPQPQLASLQ